MRRFGGYFAANYPLKYIDPTGHEEEEQEGTIRPIKLRYPVNFPRITNPFGPGHPRGIDFKGGGDPTNSGWSMSGLEDYSDYSQAAFAATSGTIVAIGEGSNTAYGWDVLDDQGDLTRVYNWQEDTWHADETDEEGNPLYETPTDYIDFLQAQNPTWTFESWDLGGADYLEIEHAGGFTTRYFHLDYRDDLVVGTTVDMGTYLGRYNMSGKTTGPHLHFELKAAGMYLDPTNRFVP
jgi:murein DD-endopeptidase MepM/ murein hydrolase activator NlpD